MEKIGECNLIYLPCRMLIRHVVFFHRQVPERELCSMETLFSESCPRSVESKEIDRNEDRTPTFCISTWASSPLRYDSPDFTRADPKRYPKHKTPCSF